MPRAPVLGSARRRKGEMLPRPPKGRRGVFVTQDRYGFFPLVAKGVRKPRLRWKVHTKG